MLPTCPTAVETPKPSAGPRETSAAKQAGESLGPQQHGNLRGGTSCPPQVQRVLILVAELTPPAAQSQCQGLLQMTVVLTGRPPGYPSLHFSNYVKEYSTVLRSLAGEGHPALLSLGGHPQLGKLPGREELPNLQWVKLWE